IVSFSASSRRFAASNACERIFSPATRSGSFSTTCVATRTASSGDSRPREGGRGGGERRPRRHGLAGIGSRLLEGPHRERQLAGLHERDAQQVVRFGLVRGLLEQRAERLDRLAELTGVLQRASFGDAVLDAAGAADGDETRNGDRA